MTAIASGSIVLNAVYDSYTAALTSPNVVIKADQDGSNADYTNAYTNISLNLSDEKQLFSIKSITPNNANITYQVTDIDEHNKKVSITSVPVGMESGNLTIVLQSSVNSTTVETVFGFTVLKDKSMLDWVKDWDTNKTEISGEYLISPKIFAGTKNEDATLSGVVIGRYGGLIGIYGYLNNKDVFHINGSDAKIAGWKMTETTFENTDGTFKMSSNGSITSGAGSGTSTIYWAINADGSATFSKGNVVFNADGSATFKGTINSGDGTIAGWTIGQTRLYSNGICLDKENHSISVLKGNDLSDTSDYKQLVQSNGGVSMFYSSDSDYGIIGYTKGASVYKAFSVGSSNFIAGWQFDDAAMWLGTRNNTSGGYASSGSLTIGTNGLRGETWYIDVNGNASFGSGKIVLGATSTISGWYLGSDSLSSKYVKLSNNQSTSGIYASLNQDISSKSDADTKTAITTYGGIYLANNSGTDCVLLGIASNGNQIFKLSGASTSKIASWYFDSDSLYIGAKTNSTRSYTQSSASITIGSNGLRGYSWYIDADGYATFASGNVVFYNNGSGYLANGNIRWYAGGNGNVANGNISWNTDGSGSMFNGAITWDSSGTMYFGKTTYLNSNGLYTGSINASQITAGTIDASRINTASILSNGNYWALNADGSGYLANKRITWTASGSGTLANGNISWNADGSGSIAGGITWTTSGVLSAGSLLSNGNYWALNQDGSGYLASKNLTWDTSGNLSLIGAITAKSGTIGGWKIEDGALSCYAAGTAQLRVEASGTRFLRINETTNSAMLSVRSDTLTGIYIYSNDSTGKCLYITGQNKAMAIESYGNVLLQARVGEKITINGIYLNYALVSSASYIMADYDDLIFPSTPSYDSTIKLPTPSEHNGKIIFITNKYRKTITLSGSLWNNGSSKTTYSWGNGSACVLFCDGAYWHVAHCGYGA